MVLFEKGDANYSLSNKKIKKALFTALDKLGNRKKVLIIPPDYTRLSSGAGALTEFAWEYYGNNLTDILPALGTHNPMTNKQISHMFGNTPKALFREHDWRNDVITVGEVPSDFVKEVSKGAVDFAWPAQMNKLITDGNYDLILSIGQVVPHEVVGMANYDKNIFVGTGGEQGINKSHFIGAAYGMEKMMGVADTPVRKIFNYASKNFISHMPIVYVQTVVGLGEDGELHTRGLYIGGSKEVFNKAAALSQKVNFKMLNSPVKKAVVYLDPSEFKSTWLGNKSIYRTRMAIHDGGELIVLAPALKEFGEDMEIDRLIRKYGYRGTPATLDAVNKNPELRNNLSAAAHLIHGSSEGRFCVTYCPGNEKENLTKEDIEGVGFKYANLNEMTQMYNPSTLKEGWNTMPSGEEIYYISNPAIGLWAYKERFKK